MLKPICKSGAMSAGADSVFAPAVPLTPAQCLEGARLLHELLMDEPARPSLDKMKMARQISGRLFAVESHRILADDCRAYFPRLRTDAHYRASLIDPKRLPQPSRISAGYDA